MRSRPLLLPVWLFGCLSKVSPRLSEVKLFVSANPLQRSSAGGLIGLACADLICLGAFWTNWKTVYFHVFSALFCSVGLAFNKIRVDQWECHVCYALMPEAKWCCRSMQSGGGSAEFDAHNPLSKQGGCKAFQPPGRVEVVLGQVTNAHKRRFMSCIKVVGFCNFSTGFMSIRLSLLCLGH